jgi:hypothetical protein
MISFFLWRFRNEIISKLIFFYDFSGIDSSLYKAVCSFSLYDKQMMKKEFIFNFGLEFSVNRNHLFSWQ